MKDGSTLVGVLTDRDLKRALDPSLGLPPKEELFVRDVFVPDAYIVDVGEPLDSVLDRLSSQHIGSALVTKRGRLVGIFTLTDAARLFSRHLRSLFRATRATRSPDCHEPRISTTAAGSRQRSKAAICSTTLGHMVRSPLCQGGARMSWTWATTPRAKCRSICRRRRTKIIDGMEGDPVKDPDSVLPGQR